jgi:translation elongation factor EF-Tu-like GTPase
VLHGIDELRPGETGYVTIKLLPAKTIRKTLKKNDAFTINEGNKVIGAGVIENALLN